MSTDTSTRGSSSSRDDLIGDADPFSAAFDDLLEGSSEPEPAPRRRRSHRAPRPPRRFMRRVRRALVLLLVFVLGAAAGAGGLVAVYLHYDGRVDRIPVAALGAAAFRGGVAAGAEPTAETSATLAGSTVLLVGSDSRADLTEDERAELAVGDADGARTDTILVLHFDSNGQAASALSIPRDSYVEIPGNGEGKVNSAFAIGGADLLVSTVSGLLGVTIDHYAEVDFAGFVSLVDALGGVNVNVCSAVSDSYSGVDLAAGPATLDGTDALAFVRQRHGLARGDLDRVARQQYVLASLLGSLSSVGTLTDPAKVTSLLSIATGALTVDDGLDLLSLGRSLADSGTVDFETVPVANLGANVNGASVVLLDDNALPGAVNAFLGTDAPDASSSPASPTSASSAAASTTAAPTTPSSSLGSSAPVTPDLGCVN